MYIETSQNKKLNVSIKDIR